MATIEELIPKLTPFGVSQEEARIYLFLNGKEPQTALVISRSLDIPRTSVYDLVSRLTELGFVRKVVRYKSQSYEAAPVSFLQTFIDKEKERVTGLTENATLLTSALTHPLIDLPNTKIRYYHGASGLRQIIWNSLSAHKETVGYTLYHRRDIVGVAFSKRFALEFTRLSLRDRVIINPKAEVYSYIKSYVKPESHQDTKNDIRVLPEKTIYISGDTIIYDDIFAVSYWKQGEVVGVEIENAEFVKTQKSIFETLWAIAKPISKFT
jgi:sugar-specific transcriptional regulator TrmB